jgi:hypothetical protein
MRTIIAGSRSFSDYRLLQETLQQHVISVIISGTAAGADRLGERFAVENSIPVERFPARWNLYGKSAGFRRNMEMAQKAEALIAFWDGKSPGTKSMINIAIGYKLKVTVVQYA